MCMRSAITIIDQIDIGVLAEYIEQSMQCFNPPLNFNPPLSASYTLLDYCSKLLGRANVHAAKWDDKLVGLAASYSNDNENYQGYLTYLHVSPLVQGKGIGGMLLTSVISNARICGMRTMAVDVSVLNAAAIKLYNKFEFVVSSTYERKGFLIHRMVREFAT